MGRGGADVAGGDDLTASWTNPANISRLKGIRVLFDSALIFTPLSFTRQAEAGKKPFPKMENQAPPYYIPFLGASYDFGFLNLPKMIGLTFAATVTGPYEGKYDYDYTPPECQGANAGNYTCEKGGPQRYSLISANTFQPYVAFVLATRITLGPVKVRLGASFDLVQTEIAQKLAINVDYMLGTDDAIIELDTVDAFKPHVTFGLTVDLPFGISIGAAVRPEMPINAEGTLTVQMPEVLAKLVEIKGKQARLELVLPLLARVGIAWKPTFHNRLLLEGAFHYEGWSSIHDITITSQDVKYSLLKGKEEPLKPIVMTRIWQNAWSVRGGIQYEVVRSMVYLRAGIMHEKSAIPTKHFNVSEVHYDRNILTGGASFRFKLSQLMLELSAAIAISLPPRELVVTDSAEQSVVISVGTEKPGPVVGNGTYDVGLMIVTFGVRGVWGG